MLVLLLLLGLAGFTGYNGNYPVAAVLAFFGFLSLVGIGSGSYVTDCPECDKQLRGLIGLKRCPECLSYGRVYEGEYHELSPDYVNKIASFAVPLGERREMPPLCCGVARPPRELNSYALSVWNSLSTSVRRTAHCTPAVLT